MYKVNITNTTKKNFIMGWNYFQNDNIITKRLLIPPQALNLECTFADEADFENFKTQNQLWFARDQLLIGNATEKKAIETNERNAKENLKEKESDINKEIDIITKNAKQSGKKSILSVKVEKE